MRLINTETLRFESFADSERPPFAILSHRWGKGEQDEVTFDDMKVLGNVIPGGKSAGYAKLKGFCDLAHSMHYKLAWMDTCCIDKSNSTELSEAINSMYRWYSDAAVCIAYLWDVDNAGDKAITLGESEWFTRGWTLQELIAPGSVIFYDRGWTEIGSRKSLLASLSDTTGIPQPILSGTKKPAFYSVAQRMSWAAHRITERVEDKAYSLMGLFDINMPMIYGERGQAFLRLQQAIIESSDDESIFAWSLDKTAHPKGYCGLLALSPASFSGCTNIIRTARSSGFSEKNVGLSISLLTFPFSMNTYYAFLNSTDRLSLETTNRYAIYVVKLPTQGQYARVMGNNDQSIALMEMPRAGWSLVRREILIRQNPVEAPSNVSYGFWLRTLHPPGHSECQTAILSRSKSSQPDRTCIAPNSCHTAGIVSLKPMKSSGGWSQIRWMKFGFDEEFNPTCLIANADSQHYGVIGRLDQRCFDSALESGPESSLYEHLFAVNWIKSKGQAPTERGHGWQQGMAVYTWSVASGGTRL